MRTKFRFIYFAIILLTLTTPLFAGIKTETRAGTDEKKPGVVRFGLAEVKTTAAGEGINPAELAAAVRNTLAEYLKTPKVEVVALEAKLPSAIETEAREKECDFVIFASVGHKKGGAGMFGKVLGKMSQTVAKTAYGSANIAGQVAKVTIMSAAAVSGSVRAKDQMTLGIKMVASANGAVSLAEEFQRKARSDGEDLITPLVEQAAQAIVEAAQKK